MSKQTKTTTQEEAKPVIVPKLRFPEFQEAEGWAQSVLVAACNMQAGKFVSASNISDRNEGGLFPCYGGNGLRGYTRTHTHNGTYPLIGRQGALCGNVRLVSGQFHATEHAVVATPKNNIDVGWLYYSLDLLNLNRFATGQAQPGLSVDVLENVALAIPPLEEEQQRIAACLSSLDDLINAQSQQLASLKTHKQGLMQQLFPREGESVPRVRFPEFRENGEWEDQPLSNFFSHMRNGFVGTATPYYEPNGICYLQGKNIKEGKIDPKNLVTVSKAFHEKQKKSQLRVGDILMVQSGHVGECAVVDEKFAGGNCHALIVLSPEPCASPLFFVYYFYAPQGLEKIASVKTGNTIAHILATDLRCMNVCTPELKEQQRIAACLSSLDDLITAETQKLESLRIHKKGLMQQLFPTAEQIET